MVTLTEAAARKIAQFIAEEEQKGRSGLVLRFAVKPGGCAGLRYGMWLDDTITAGDEVAEQHGVKIVVDKVSLPYVRNVIIDYVDTLERSGFTIDNPDAQGTCACGHSFH